MNSVSFPDDRRFAFTIFDDTDNSTLANTRPVYELLSELGMRTTKSVWVEPPRGPSSGSSLQDPEYRTWIRQLQNNGFEIGFHGVGDGDFDRDEIIHGLETYREILGQYPSIHANHQSNSHNVYWWHHRFPPPFNWLYSLFNGFRGRGFNRGGGHIEDSEVFWGDALQKHIRFIRNLTFNSIDTLACDPAMPYLRKDTPLANYWFSSSDGHTIDEFNDLLAPKNIDQLEENGSACIVYTHFASGFVGADGQLDLRFRSQMEKLAARNGWFVPAGELLEHLLQQRGSISATASHAYQLRLSLRWGIDRILKRLRHGR